MAASQKGLVLARKTTGFFHLNQPLIDKISDKNVKADKMRI